MAKLSLNWVQAKYNGRKKRSVQTLPLLQGKLNKCSFVSDFLKVGLMTQLCGQRRGNARPPERGRIITVLKLARWKGPSPSISCSVSRTITWTTQQKNILAAGVTRDTLDPLSPVCRDKSGFLETCTSNEPSYCRHSGSNSVPFGEVVENFNAF